MNEHCLSLTLSLDDEAPLDALEAVLAVARRGNVRLKRLDVAHCTVAITLQADDPDLLALCNARLHNLVGVFDISMSENFTIVPAQLLTAC